MGRVRPGKGIDRALLMLADQCWTLSGISLSESGSSGKIDLSDRTWLLPGK